MTHTTIFFFLLINLFLIHFHFILSGKQLYAVRACRTIGKADMKLNDSTPVITVDAETYRVEADGIHLTCEPSSVLPLSQRYYLF